MFGSCPYPVPSGASNGSDNHGLEPALRLGVNGLIILRFDASCIYMVDAVPSPRDWKGKTFVDFESLAGRAGPREWDGLGRLRLRGLPGVPQTCMRPPPRGATSTHFLAAGPGALGSGGGGNARWGRGPQGPLRPTAARRAQGAPRSTPKRGWRHAGARTRPCSYLRLRRGGRVARAALSPPRARCGNQRP